ncbi:pathogenesis-related protein 1-like [Vicia villosa]|uniref:pathogenesis-related protein 1-like n=1 Tax=Vicia villosa TaxID=3911 RepID=UPI00273BE14E|nr:pathogenesis-related protein 1-like [Vicia villosa]XP_058751560.1 pathogenesis-related protein 1-like [Vicia villosa]
MISMFAPLMVVLTILTHTTYAQNSPQDFLNAHNRARSEVGVGPITWDANVAAFAKNYVNQLKGSCQLVHSGGQYGENLAWGSPDLTGTAAVDMWIDEIQNYDYNSNSCFNGECLHYTQVVWRDSVRLGCARVRCNNGRSTIVSCNYDPPGNFIGEWPFENSPFEIPLSFKKHDEK